MNTSPVVTGYNVEGDFCFVYTDTRRPGGSCQERDTVLQHMMFPVSLSLIRKHSTPDNHFTYCQENSSRFGVLTHNTSATAHCANGSRTQTDCLEHQRIFDMATYTQNHCRSEDTHGFAGNCSILSFGRLAEKYWRLFPWRLFPWVQFRPWFVCGPWFLLFILALIPILHPARLE